MTHIWTRHVRHMNEPRLTSKWVMTHISMSRVTHLYGSRHTYQWVMSHIWMSHVTHITESLICYPRVHDSAASKSDTTNWDDQRLLIEMIRWLIHMCDMTHWDTTHWDDMRDISMVCHLLAAKSHDDSCSQVGYIFPTLICRAECSLERKHAAKSHDRQPRVTWSLGCQQLIHCNVLHCMSSLYRQCGTLSHIACLLSRDNAHCPTLHVFSLETMHIVPHCMSSL